jgi:probable rRNA maturation factor
MKTMKLSIHNQTDYDIKDIKEMMKNIFKTIKNKKNIQIIFVTDSDMHHMNFRYRGIDKPTDVLSFINDDDTENSLGDVFISIDQAKRQAEAYHHSFEREIGFLAVHGYLHLIGYDHQNEADESKMNALQEEILKSANLERV